MSRFIQVIIAIIMLVVLLPILIAILILVGLDGHSPFFIQQRVGRYGRLFNLYKIRTMVAKSEVIGSYQTQKNDSRITYVGGFVRRFNLDELLQLLNVIKGDMNLVGPRPDVVEQLQLYEERDQALRLSVRPGITGLAQVSGRSALTFNKRLELDKYYVRNRTSYLDMIILLKTILPTGNNLQN